MANKNNFVGGFGNSELGEELILKNVMYFWIARHTLLQVTFILTICRGFK